MYSRLRFFFCRKYFWQCKERVSRKGPIHPVERLIWPNWKCDIWPFKWSNVELGQDYTVLNNRNPSSQKLENPRWNKENLMYKKQYFYNFLFSFFPLEGWHCKILFTLLMRIIYVRSKGTLLRDLLDTKRRKRRFLKLSRNLNVEKASDVYNKVEKKKIDFRWSCSKHKEHTSRTVQSFV